jgi:hypothetical protein
MREFISSAAKNAVTNGPLTLLQRTNLKAFSNRRYKRIHFSKDVRSFGSAFFVGIGFASVNPWGEYGDSLNNTSFMVTPPSA